MSQFIGGIALLVRDYDEAIAWYTQVLGFELIEDTDLGGGKRWVQISPPGARECRLLLAKANSEAEQAAVGCQAGGRVWLFLRCDDFWREHARMLAAGVAFLEDPRSESYGTVAVFKDLYGNKWDLLG